MMKSIVYEKDDKDFYMVCNKVSDKLGFYVLKINGNDPLKGIFLIKWKNKLDIKSCCMHILKYPDLGYSELVMGFKSIFVNSYSIFCIDISQEDSEPLLFRHESR